MKNIIKTRILKRLYSIIATFFLSIILITMNSANALGNIKTEVIEKVRKGIVTINTRVSNSAYASISEWAGTGFVSDKENGIIVTNCHVVGGASVGSYFVTFYNGKRSEAKVVYYDIYRDYAILKTTEIPAEVENINFSKIKPTENQFVFIVGNNEGQSFSFHSGYLSDLYSINGHLPQHSYIVNLNSAGGSSGSPLLNADGECIGLNYAGDRTYAIVLKSEYVEEALNAIKSKKDVVRKSTGIITSLYSIDKAVQHRKFPKELAEEYVKKFKDAKSRILSVSSVINSYEAYDSIKSGDIIWEVQGKMVGPSLYDFDQIIDTSKSDSISITVIRDGVKKTENVHLRDLSKNKITKMVQFAGATFFDADDYIAHTTGIKIGKLSIFNVQSGSGFGSIKQAFYNNDLKYYRLNVTHINGNKIDNLGELAELLPKISQEKFIRVDYKNHNPYWIWNGAYSSSHQNLVEDLALDASDMKPRVFEFNSEKMEWIQN